MAGRTITTQQADKLAQARTAGLSYRNAARLAGVSKDTAVKYLRQWGLDKVNVEQFRASRADIMAGVQAEIGKAMFGVVSQLTKEEIAALDARQKGALLRDLATSCGIAYDKERLEKGQSTANIHSLREVAIRNINRAEGIPGSGGGDAA